jgi:hypothetical protein
MFRLNRAVLALALAFLVSGSLAFAQTPPAAPASSTPTKFVDTIKGPADVQFIRVSAKVEGDFNVTTFKVKNMSPKAIARLTLEEFVYGSGASKDTPITGDRAFLRKPLMPGEIETLVLRTPRKPGMSTNNFKFSHANGEVKPKQVKTF